MRRMHCWVVTALWHMLLACAHASPPLLAIDSLPIAVVCPANGSAGKAAGARLVRKGDLYQATMTPADWGGHFSRQVLPACTTSDIAGKNVDGGGSCQAGVGAAPVLVWDAGAILTGQPGQPPMPEPELRNIHTAIIQPDGTLAMIPFAWPSLSPEQRALLDREDQAGEQRLAYLRGDRALEGSRFRRRSSVLGDSIHSTPVYVAGAGRRAAIYLGANDGMLHGFDADTGQELFAYIPNALMAELHRLTDPAYVHRAYVDGPAGTGEAILGGGRKTVLVSGMGGGAQGVFALDVTDPTRFADGLGVLWEFTDRDDAMMGNVTTPPQIAKVRTNGAGASAVYRYFAIVASGVNNYDSGDARKGALFLLALDKPHDEPWQRDTNYYRLITPISEPALANALNAPVLLADSDGALRYAYAGDLQGNLWRFDFGGAAPWAKAVGPGAGGTPLFVARDASGRRQAIAQQPLLAYAPKRGYMVLFGTGQLIEKADRAAARRAPQSYYAIIDSLLTPPDLVTSRRQLTQRFLDGAAGDVLFNISGASMDAGSKGWYVDFLQAEKTGERSIDSGVLANGDVFFNTLIPGADPCAATRARTYALNVLTGLAGDSTVAAILPGNEPIVGLLLPEYAPSPVLLPMSTTRANLGPAGRISVKATAAVANIGAEGVVVAGSVKSLRRAGRLNWREVSNWRELHEAAK
ncbi:pilus assembly protein [Duganella aceris]|uniref:Pilus assembly protein PilY n=1 Tax=Duganella aceris TaxID=2703883 RepID=A0ABX0FUW2_9BURK|nr:PilC/PilY family type IV pilus protein [Duganella aceris]NGZ88497.1 pilus assembly protein PilY [Duganella aceris]